MIGSSPAIARTHRSETRAGKQPADRTFDDTLVLDAVLVGRTTLESCTRAEMAAHLRRHGRQQSAVLGGDRQAAARSRVLADA